jgi:hypothetical protein
MPFSVLVLKILDNTVLRAVLSMRWGEKLSSSEPCTQNLRYLLFADGDISQKSINKRERVFLHISCSVPPVIYGTIGE